MGFRRCESCGDILLIQDSYPLYFDGHFDTCSNGSANGGTNGNNGLSPGFRCDLCFYRDTIIACSRKVIESMTANHRNSVDRIRKIEEDLQQVLAKYVQTKTKE
jgi:hypothetical protein